MIGGLFVAGADTDVGKTVAAACLVRALDGDYWKPVQAGISDGTDTATVARLTGLSADRLHPPAYEFAEPLPPHQAARLEGVAIDMERFQLPRTKRPLVVEGAGGLLVPLNDRHTMIDLIVRLGLPVVLVTRSGLGAINHTLLSLEALNARAVPIIGVIVNGPPNPVNVEAIRHYGRVRVIIELQKLVPLDGEAIERTAKRLSGVLE